MRERVEEVLELLPTQPGVYLMKGAKREVLYVGKATNLRSRVRSYFSGNDPRAFVRYLDDLLYDIETIVTANPKEALLLENTLIKKHKPRFNVMLRDDKNYLSIRIDKSAKWPRVELVRRIRNDNATYFGPYHSASKVRETLNVLNRHFNLRTCRDSVLNNRVRPCLQYQIQRCPGPCVIEVDADAYMDSVDDASLFLLGKEKQLTTAIEERMIDAAQAMRFEEAARLRDQLGAVRDSLVKQSAVQTQQVDRDIVGLHREAERAAVTLMQYRDGCLQDVRSYAFNQQLLPDDELIGAFIAQRYVSAVDQLPVELLLPNAPPDVDDLAETLSELRGRKLTILIPKRGEKMRLVALATENAANHFAESLSTTAQAEKALEGLQKRLRLPVLPRTMECYDISNVQGSYIVASQVVFQDAMPDKARYRRIKIRSTQTQDDFLSMYEVITRRAKRSDKTNDPMPDLIVIDGGKGQLNSALQALKEVGHGDQLIISLAKSRVVGNDDSKDTTVRSFERVFMPGQKDPIELPVHGEETYLLERIRDEAHRTAITFHRDQRRKGTLRSKLEEIPGIGAERRRTLLTHFGSLKAVKAASLRELEAAPSFNRSLAARVYAFFQPDAFDAPPDDS
ncbi:MAG: excinuclease ABC subunit C [Bradymonadia bacterium]|jgi:excinuclease ABC subunit C